MAPESGDLCQCLSLIGRNGMAELKRKNKLKLDLQSRCDIIAGMAIPTVVVEQLRQFPNLLIEWAPGLALAVIILLIGQFVVGRLSRASIAASRRIPNFDETLARLVGFAVMMVGMGIVIVSSLSAMHVNLAFLATVVASLLIALGFALQNSLGDVASGLIITALRPYRIGDEVEINGEKGVIKEIGLFATRLVTRDNIDIVISNSDAISNTIRNYAAFGDRRLEMDFRISYDSSIADAIEAILSATRDDPRIKSDPAPWAKVTGLGDSAVFIQLRVWCHWDDYRKIEMDLPIKVKAALDAAGAEIPFDYVVTHQRLKQEKAHG